MNTRTRWTLVVVALLIPVTAWAQHHVAPAKPAAESSRPGPPAPEGDAGDLEAWSSDDWLALALEDELLALEGEAGDELVEDTIGPDGDRRIVRRRVERVPGRHGMHRMMGHRMHGGMGMGGHGPGMLARWGSLDLTEAQRDKLHALHEAQARKAVQRRADMQLARMDLHKLMREDSPSSPAVNAQIEKLSRLHAEGLKSRFDTHMQARALLTPEQLKQLRSGGGAPRMEHRLMDGEESKKR